MCTQMLMHSIAHRGCPDNVRESELESDPGSKIPCRIGDSAVSVSSLAFSVRCTTNWAILAPGQGEGPFFSSRLCQHLCRLISACLAFVCTARTKIVVHVVKDYTFWCEKARGWLYGHTDLHVTHNSLRIIKPMIVAILLFTTLRALICVYFVVVLFFFFRRYSE